MAKKTKKTEKAQTSESFQELMREGKPYAKVSAELLEDKLTVRTTFEGDRVIDITYLVPEIAYMMLKIERQECKPYFRYIIRDVHYHKDVCNLELTDVLYMKYLEMRTTADNALKYIYTNAEKSNKD